MTHAVYIGFAGFFGSPGLSGLYVAKSKSLGSKLTVLSIIWFNRLCLLMYLSKLAAFLITSDLSYSVNSVQAGIMKGYRFCVPRWNIGALRGLYGDDLNIVIDPADGREGILNRGNLLAYLDDGTCDLSFLMDDDLGLAHATDTTHCDKQRIGWPVTSLPRGIPLFSTADRALSNWFLGFEGSGAWRQILQQAEKPS